MLLLTIFALYGGPGSLPNGSSAEPRRQHLGDKRYEVRATLLNLVWGVSRQGWDPDLIKSRNDLRAPNAEIHPTTVKATPKLQQHRIGVSSQ